MTAPPARKVSAKRLSFYEVECRCASAAVQETNEPRHLGVRTPDNFAAFAELTGSITHDFRNILAVIEAGVAVAERHSNEPDRVRMCLAGAREGVERGLQLTARLLQPTRHLDLEPQLHDINDLLKQLEVFLTFGAGRDVHLTFELARAIPCCVIDAAGFDAAILNLVTNARDAMPKGGTIKIGTSVATESQHDAEHPRTFVHLRVEDTGRGMSRAVLRKVFDPSFTTKRTGTGRGVPQVCAFMKRMGGHINVKSALGSGTTFDLAFPAVLATARGHNADRRSDSGPADEVRGAVRAAVNCCKRGS